MKTPVHRRTPWVPHLKAFAALLLLLPGVRMARAQSVEISLERNYLGFGETGKGTVNAVLTGEGGDGKLKISCVREVAVPAGPVNAPLPVQPVIQELATQAVAASAPASAIPIEFNTGGMIEGTLRIKAELYQGQSPDPVATAWSAPVKAGFRQHVELFGEWDVTSIKLFDYNAGNRPKDWKPPQPKTLPFPGGFPFDEWFRGWVTLKREIAWKAPAGLSPRFVYVSGVSNSARIVVNGDDLGETFPVEEIAVLTHWVEYHSPFKGEENRQKRMLAADVDPLPPQTLALKKTLPPQGKAEIEVTIRGTHRQWRYFAPYGILGELHLEMAPSVAIKAVNFDTEKPGELRRFKFKVQIANDSGKEFHGKLRGVYGRYSGATPYTGSCPAYAGADQAVTLAPGENTIDVAREEMPRFDTCHATFILLAEKDAPLDAQGIDFHTVAVEIRNRREIYLNNERFIFKGQGGEGDDPNGRWQIQVKGGNAFRGWSPFPSKRYPGLYSFGDMANNRLTDGVLTSAGSALLASCEKCAFWDPKDTSNITHAVSNIIKTSADSPGIVIWEATNELHGEPEECREAIVDAFHKLDPYHRPVLATKGSGEWEAEAHEGRVRGVDIVGVQYLLSKEATDSVTAAISEQPILSTEVNWNDGMLQNQNLWQTWLDKGVCGALLFDYGGNALNQPVPLVPPPDNDRQSGSLIRQVDRNLYQDMVAATSRNADGRLVLTLGNRMPYPLRRMSVTVREFGRFDCPDLAPGDAATILLPADFTGVKSEIVPVRAEYATHGGLKHTLILTPRLAAPAQKGGGK